ncbi:hypothetical protein BRARA_H00797 [Brassica rapa]|uniref:CCHC-type domain-containing protein n=1 Tax=Brassica campestris TaxID=3711 RepID=A0A397Y971_BRACM|nr:hypothetical protein BRARA_H00797 [Brassica rapa]
MKKKKPKNSQPKSPPNSRSTPPARSPSTENQNPPEDSRRLDASMVVSDAQIDPRADGDAQQAAEIKDSPLPPKIPSTEVPNSPGKDQPLVESKAVSDAPIVPQAEKDAQQPGADRLISDNLNPNPTKTVIDTLVSDPSTEGLGIQSADIVSYFDRVPSTEGLEAIVPPLLATADAKMISLSSQEANVAFVSAGAISNVEAEPALLIQNEALRPEERLSKKGEAFTLPSGEACINIPNSVIEKHRKSWEPFVMGQFYSDPPSQGTLHNIVNGIWSKNYRDIAVSKMEGFAFLFRIPNAATRQRVINQGLWQIEGQTMFVNKWEPGVTPSKPELTSAPIWLELRKVPLQFFNEDGLERIASLVGHPMYLHPLTKNKSNLEVAKVYTIIDPRKPLPEAVNVKFDSGEICRVLVSSPWMPPVCDLCKEIGHSSKRCPSIAKVCSHCNSKEHVFAKCPLRLKGEQPGRKTRRGRSKVKVTENDKVKQQWREIVPSPTASDFVGDQAAEAPAIGESSGTPYYLRSATPRKGSVSTKSSNSDMQPDSSDVDTTDSDLEEGELSLYDQGFETVRYRKNFSGRKGNRGKGPKPT